MRRYTVYFWMVGDPAPVMSFPEAFDPFDALEKARADHDFADADVFSIEIEED